MTKTTEMKRTEQVCVSLPRKSFFQARMLNGTYTPNKTKRDGMK